MSLRFLSRSLLSALVIVGSATTAIAVEAPVTVSVDLTLPLRPLDPAWFGSSAEYYCAGLVEGLKHPQTVQALKDTGIGYLRWPGGTSSLWYFWDAPRQSYSPDWIHHWLSSEDFIAATTSLGVASLGQVNTYQFRREGYQTFDQAKALVAPGNIGEAAKYAGKWVAKAKEQDWKIGWWEIGNEDWVYWTGRQHADIATAYAKEMRAADPSIKILAQGMCGEWKSGFVDHSGPAWTEDLASRLTPGTVDGISVHCYAAGVLKDQPRPLPDELAGVFARLGSSCAEVAALRPMLARYGHAGMQIWVTEYNLMQNDPKGPGGLTWWQHLGHGLALADWTGRLLDLGVDRLAVHDLVGHPVFEMVDLTHKGSVEDPRVTAPALALQAFTGVKLAGLLSVSTGNNPTRLAGTFFDVKDKKNQTDAYSAVGAWAFRRADGGLRLVLVNRDLTQDQPVTLAVNGETLTDATPVARRRLGAGLVLEATNFGAQHLAWDTATSTWGTVRTESLPAHSLTTIDLPLAH